MKFGPIVLQQQNFTSAEIQVFFYGGTGGQQRCHVSHSHIQPLRNPQRVLVEPGWKLARCIVGDWGEAVERTQCEASAAKFLSNSKSDEVKCCRKEKSASFWKCVVDSSERDVASPLGSSGRRSALIFADFSVISGRWGLLGRGLKGSASCGRNLILHSLRRSFQTGNVFSLGRTAVHSSHFSWILLSSNRTFVWSPKTRV